MNPDPQAAAAEQASTELCLALPSGAGQVTGLAWRNEGAPRLLALHGWLDNAASFIPMAPYLADFDLVALDLPGHGHSDWREDGASYHWVDYLPAVMEALDALAWERCHLLGHSLGGSLVITLAACQPQRFQSVTSIEALGPMATPEEQTLDNLRQALASRSKTGSSRLRTFSDAGQAAQARAGKGGLSLAAAQLLSERSLRKVAGGWQWRSDPRLRRHSLMRFTEAQVLNILGGLDLPASLVLADPPTPFPGEALGQRRIEASGCRVVRLPGHHHLHMETPAPVARVVSEQLQAEEHRDGGEQAHESS